MSSRGGEGESIIAGSRRNYAAEYRARIERGLAEGLSRSQAAGHPRPDEPSVSEVRAAASRSGFARIRDFLFAAPSDWRSRQSARPLPPPPPSSPFDDVLIPVPPEQLLPPEERGFVVRDRPTGDPFVQKAFDFGFYDYDENGDLVVVDEYGADLLYRGWFDFQSYDFDETAFTRDEFFDYTDLTWRDFDDWREYISEYLGAA